MFIPDSSDSGGNDSSEDNDDELEDEVEEEDDELVGIPSSTSWSRRPICPKTSH